MPRRPARRLLLAVLTLALAPLSTASAGDALRDPARPGRTPAARDLVVTGYAMESLRPSVIRRDAHALDIVGVGSLGVKLDGSGVTRSDAALRGLLHAAHREGLRAELLLSNWSPRTGDFDPALATQLLSSPAHRRAAADRLVAIVTREGWDGLTIDLEAMHARDRRGLVAFMRLLARRLPERVELSMDIGARTSIRDYHRSGFSLRSLAATVDRIALMTYSQHGSWSAPGPNGALPWQRRAMRVLARQVPISMVDLGIAGFGYIWPASGRPHELRPRQARALAEEDGARQIWHPVLGEWSTTLHDGTVIWWSDRRSYVRRLALARELGTHGVAMWVLGWADPLP